MIKYTCTVDINAPIGRVAKLFDNKHMFREWQEGFVSFEHLAGKPGSVGATAKITYRIGKNTIELTETIRVKNLPDEVTALYEHKHMDNTMKNCFIAISPDRTRLVSQLEYIRLRGFMPRLMALLMPGMFKKQTQQWLDNFRVFAEKEQAKRS